MGDEGPGDGTVGKALDVLDRVAMAGRPMRFSELLASGPYPKATMYRFLQTLTNQGMLAYDPDRHCYAVGIRLVRLAHAAWAQSSLAPIARPWIDALSGEVGETIHLAQMDQAQVLYVDKRHATRAVEMFSQAGKIGPAYCTGVGKVMLAFLPHDVQARAIERQSFHSFTANTMTTRDDLVAELQVIRKRGYAFDNEEHEPGIICIALPILTRTGLVMGALSVTSTPSRSSLDALALLVPRVTETVRAIANAAENWRFPEDHQGL